MIYFAQETSDNIAQEIEQKVKDYREHLRTTGRLQKLRTSHTTYYPRSVGIENVGEYGEFASVVSNEYANLIRHIKSMVASNKPAWDQKASNSDSASISSAQLANGILDYVMTEKRCETYLSKALETGLRLQEGWIAVDWDAQTGEEIAVDPTNNFPVKTGDVALDNFNMLEVQRDFRERSLGNCNWFIVSKEKNKYDLAARYPAQAEQILAVTFNRQLEHSLDPFERAMQGSSDMVEVHTLIHNKTAQVPGGRLTIICGDAVLFDGELPYRKINLVCFRPEEEDNKPFGHTPFFDLLPLQEVGDLLLSTVVSNNRAFGAQSIVSEKGSGVEITQVSEGLNLIEFAQGSSPPSSLQLTASAPETYNLIGQISSQMERLSGVSQISRGTVNTAQLSGSQMALLQSQQIQFASQINQAYQAMLEDVGTLVVQHYQSFAVAPRVIQLQGKTGRAAVKEFSQVDLNGINRVTVSSGNALSKTLAGRLEVAKDLLQNGLVTRPEQYLEVLTSGQLTPLIESETSQLSLVRSENEFLQEGQTVQALISDKHDLHCAEHLQVLASPEVRANPAITNSVLQHVMEHMQLWRTADPMILALSNTPPAPQAQPTQAGQPEVPGQVNNTTPPPVQESQDISQPQMPVNPMSGERFDPNLG